MKIKRLEILNIASIEKATIDFDAAPLKDTDVFLISGKIGAGKSTILDAICLALYGTTPRINDGVRDKIAANDDELTGVDPRQLMRQNTGEAFARLTFDGTDGNSYEAEWQVQRGVKKKPSSALNADVWTLKNLTTGEVLTGSTGTKGKAIKEAVQKAVGLDFDQFCRTTMLAQGEFTKFLKSNEKEKASIMEKITGTKVYSEIGAKIYKITRDKEMALKNESDKMSGIKLLSQEEIDAKSARIKEINDASETLLQEWKLAVEARRDLKDLDDSQKEIKQLDEELNGVLQQKYFAGLKGRQWVAENHRQLMERHRTLAEKIAQKQDKAAVYEQSQTVLQLLKDIHGVRRKTAEKKNEKPTLDANLAAAMKAFDEKEKACQALQKTTAEKELEVKADEARMNQYALPTLRKQKEDLTAAINGIDNLMRRWRDYQELCTQIRQLEKEVPVKQETLKTEKELLASLEKLKELSAQTVDQWAKKIRATLTEGCTCPVCQQTLQQPLPVEAELDQAYQEHLKRYEAQREVVQGQQDQLNQLNAKIQALRQQLNEKRLMDEVANYGIKDLGQTEEVLTRTKQAKDDERYKLGLRITEAESFEKLLNGKKDQLNVFLKQEKEALSAKNTAEQALLTAQSAIKAYETAMEGFERSIQEASQDVDAILGDKLEWPCDWHVQLADFGVMLKNEAEQYRNDKETLQSTENQMNDAERVMKNLDEIRQKTLSLQHDWTPLVTVEAEKHDRIEELWNELYARLVAVHQLKTSALGKQQQAEQRLEAFKAKHSLEDLEGQIVAVETKINTLKEESAVLTKVLEDDAVQRKDKAALQERITAMTEDFAKWKRLSGYFGSADGSQFQKIAQGYILGNLLHSANSYLRSLHPRYSLEVVPGTLFISLVDAYQGYATRFVSSLSGGESFLVSLALALALADIGQNLAVDTLFIDEGFGSLSGVELNNAINTLRALHRANGRHVGIISHIEAVKSSIPVQIQVIQEGNFSSSVVEVRVEG